MTTGGQPAVRATCLGLRRRLLAAAAGVAMVTLAAAAQAAAGLQPWTGPAHRPLAMRDTGGRSHDLADYRGKVVVINFWAVWCEPCRDEMPSLRQLRERLGGRPFEVLAVNLGDSDARIADFTSKVPLNFPVLVDRIGASKRDWEVGFLPLSFVVDAEGRIRYRVVGELDWTRGDVVAAIGRLLPATQAR